MISEFYFKIENQIQLVLSIIKSDEISNLVALT